MLHTISFKMRIARRVKEIITRMYQNLSDDLAENVLLDTIARLLCRQDTLGVRWGKGVKMYNRHKHGVMKGFYNNSVFMYFYRCFRYDMYMRT